ncbi:restriction endonuclease subunit S [Neobacillus sp. YX16]|uniref:restriction endonuclease subunit S n=1 Tax=Neobacillus sp. YX16 TaxID=3047874 RepID=UPI0024C39ACC|nr:restriction endonuclease subunit S [Neobacillus sp. YX16]WHZ03398.1 restriction endonuclease subunit S [Neobacillus sp. YX16]
MKNKRTPDIRFAGFTEDWEQRKLGELLEICSAARVHKNEWTTSGVRFFRSSDVVSNFNGKKNIPAFISYSLYDELSKKSGIVQTGDILVTGGGSIGIPYLVEDQEPLYFKDADLIWLKSANKIDGYFIYSFFVTPQLRKYISSITHIGTISHYTIEQAKDTPIILPERVEQTLIGNFFKQLDETIALYQQELTTLKQTKQGFMQKMFPKEGESVPDVRFPGFTGDWEHCKLGEIMDVTSVKRIHQSDWTDKGVRFLRARDIVAASKNEEPSDYLYISVDKYNEYSKTSGKVSQGDLLVTGVGSIGVPMLVTDDEPIYFKDGNIIWFKNEHRIEGDFFYYSFKNNKIQKYIRDVAGIGTVGTYTIDSGKKTPISLPSFEEQTKIGNFFKQLDDTIILYQRELEALKETKKAFLQKMFV